MQFESIVLNPRTQDLTDQPFGRLTVLAFAGYRKSKAYWTCQCLCGIIKDIAAIHLRKKLTESCGCLAIEIARATFTTHGKSTTREYKIWGGMIRRCESPSAESYFKYGARGITVCEAWHHFPTFYKDMGPRPTPQHSLERIKNNEGYNPENCVWETPKIQSRNKRNNVLLTYQGITQCAEVWASLTGIQAQNIRYRTKHGWSDEEALTIPVTHRNRHRLYYNIQKK